MRLLSLLKSEERNAIDHAWRRYAALLEADSGDAKAIAEMKGVMKTLGKSASDAEADAGMLREARELLPGIRDGIGLEQRRTDAHESAVRYAAETERIAAGRAAELRRLQELEDELSSRWLTAAARDRQLRDLRDKQPKLLRDVESPELR